MWILMKQEMMRVVVASAGQCANRLHLTSDRQPCQHLITQFLRGQILFLMPNQQYQRTEGNSTGTLYVILTLEVLRYGM